MPSKIAPVITILGTSVQADGLGLETHADQSARHGSATSGTSLRVSNIGRADKGNSIPMTSPSSARADLEANPGAGLTVRVVRLRMSQCQVQSGPDWTATEM